MSTDQHIATYDRMVGSIRNEAESYAFVAVDEHGEVFYGANYGQHPEAILRHLKQIERGVKQYIERQTKLTPLPPELPPRPSTPMYAELSDEATA